MAVSKSVYGIMNGNDVHAFIIENTQGAKAQIIEKGATLDKLFIKDKSGNFIDILVGHDNLDGHINRSDYQGVVVGQYANRIKSGKFTIDGTEYNVTCNEKASPVSMVAVSTALHIGMAKPSPTTQLNSHISALTARTAFPVMWT